MNYQQIERLLDEIFTEYFGFANANWSSIANSLKVASCKKNTTIRLPNQKEKQLFFIVDGAVGTILHKKNKLICIDICVKGEFAGDYQSLLTCKISPMEVIAVTKCTYLVIPFESLMLVYAQASESQIEKIARKAAESLYISKNEEIIDLKTLSARDRYIKILTKQPSIVQNIPLKYLAAYLGITAESMSRIRKEIATELFLS